MKIELTALEAKNEAQKLAFAPLFFQAVVAMQELGILQYISKYRKGINVDAVATALSLTTYGVRTLCEAASCVNVVDYIDGDTVKLGKVGFFFNSDVMTQVNVNFVNDVCYSGAKFLTESIRNSKPEGLKLFGNWKTVYEGLSQFPDREKKSWFDFDHYYSDDAFPYALEIVFGTKPTYIFDIGGNTGKWAIACCNYNADVKVKILDLPGQLAVSKKNAESNNYLNRIDFHKIDLLDTAQKIPQGADAIWMSQFLDCFSENEILNILINVRNASSADTAIYIMEPFIDNQRYDAAGLCLTATSLYFTIIANGNSKMYSIHSMTDLVNKAGLKVIETFPLIGDSYHTILKCEKVK